MDTTLKFHICHFSKADNGDNTFLSQLAKFFKGQVNGRFPVPTVKQTPTTDHESFIFQKLEEETKEPAILNLILTKREEMVDEPRRDTLGKSDIIGI